MLRPNLPRPFEAVILRLLEKNPDARFSTAKETALALRKSLEAADLNEEPEAAAAVAILDALARGRLVGRTVELDEARQLWRRALEGNGHAVLLSGEPGAGKTRLAREVTIQAAVDGATVMAGGCYEYEATTPYLPFVEAFRRLVREQKDDSALRAMLGDAAPQIAKLAPEIESRLGPFPARAELPPHEERLLFFDAVAQVLANIARQRGLLLFVDDLHWADRGTLWLLGHLLRQLRDERALIVGCYRETELDRTHALSRAFIDWNRERLVTRIAVRRFEVAETNAQLSALLGEEVSAEFGEAVHRETEGNPFFIEEVLKALIEQGSVKRESGRWKRCDVGDLVIPQSVKEAIGNRLDRVSDQSNDVLRVAAVLGKTFTFEELQAAANDASEDALLDALDESVNAQLIVATSNDSFSFTHDKIREVLYEELNPIRRRRLHRHAAEGLERRGVECEIERQGVLTSCTVERLAYHYIQAGDYEHGLDYAKRAAAAAESVFAIDEVIAAYSRALECAESLSLVDEQLALEEAIGKTYLLHGDLIPAAEHFERAMMLTKDPLVRARLQCEAAQSLVANGNQRGVEYLHEALKVLDPVKHPLETANALANEARFHHLAGRHRKAIELLTRAAELIEPVISSGSFSSAQAPMISQVYPYLAGAHQHYGLFEDSNEWARRAMALGERLNISFMQAMGWEFLGENAIHLGEYARALEYCEHEREIVERIHSRERRAWTHFVAAMSAWRSGDTTRSDREYSEGIAIAEATGERRVGNLLKGNYAEFKAIQGIAVGRETPEGQTLLDAALELARENFQADHASTLLYSRFESHRCLASVRFSRGELIEAEQLCAAAYDFVWGTESRVTQMWIGPLYTDVLIAVAHDLKSHEKDGEATEKLNRAREIVHGYRELVSVCQSPHYVREAERLERELSP